MTLIDGVTLIYITSPIPSHPSAELIEDCITSMKQSDYDFHETIISYDCPKKTNADYDEYKKYMKKTYPTFTHAERITHGHFIGTLKNALLRCKTKYFLVVQHDIKLIGAFPINEILKYTFDWRICFTHHKKNGLVKPTHWYPIIEETDSPILLKTFGWSERIFMSTTEFMMNKINTINKQKRSSAFIENILYRDLNRMYTKLENIKTYKKIPKESSHKKKYETCWDDWRCFAIKSKICYHNHLFGRTLTQSSSLV